MEFIGFIKDIAVILFLSVAVLGLNGAVLWFSVRNTLSRETRVEIATTVEDSFRYALWNIVHTLKENKVKVISWLMSLSLTAVILVVVTVNLRRGIWTFSNIGDVAGYTVVVAIAIFVCILMLLGYCVYKEQLATNK